MYDEENANRTSKAIMNGGALILWAALILFLAGLLFTIVRGVTLLF